MPTRLVCVGKIADDASATRSFQAGDFAHPTQSRGKGAAVGFMREGP
jgi:hypothetical protein